MKLKLLVLYILFLLLVCSKASAQSVNIKGVVLKDKDHEALQGVSIRIINSTHGSTSDSTGAFILNNVKIGNWLQVSNIGYKTIKLKIKSTESLVINLKEEEVALNEVLIKPKENPAWQIIRKAHENIKVHDPQKYASIQADFYSKFNYRADYDVNIKKNDTLKNYKFTKGFFVFETSGKFYLKNKQRKEVIYNQVGNFPSFIPFGSYSFQTLNPFGFYNEFLVFKIKDGDVNTGKLPIIRNYLNPIYDTKFRNYDFEIKDTLLLPTPRFLINYKPIEGKNFDSFKGFLEIDTLDFAIVKVAAISADTLTASSYSVFQEYKKIHEKWYPTERTVSIRSKIDIKNSKMIANFNETEILNNCLAEIKDPIYFDGATRVVVWKADTTHVDFFNKNRKLEIDSMDHKLYDRWEVHPKYPKFYNFTKKADDFVRKYITGINPHNLIVFSFYGLDYNLVEGIKVGGIIQNNIFNYPRWGFQLGGNYSFKLKGFQEKAQLSYFITKDRQNSINAFYTENFDRPGSVNFIGPLVSFPQLKALDYVADSIYIDKIKKLGLKFTTKPLANMQVNLSGFHEIRSGYNYSIFGNTQNHLELNNVVLDFRYARKETIVRSGYYEIISNPAYPIIAVTMKKSWGQGYDFWQSNLSLLHFIRTKKAGALVLNLQGGIADGKIPFTHLFNNLGTGRSLFNYQSLGLPSSDLVSFAYNNYLMFDVTQSFGKTLLRTKSMWFQPEFSIGNNLVYSKLDKTHQIADLNLRDFSKIYPTAHFTVSNIFRIKILNVFAGIGVQGSWAYLSSSKSYFIKPIISFQFN